ncbi:unnamed protein product [Fraxinus pennsylvanica]|uniref:Uncharacterized protein n=1 Tax=Fraxinus pennsylvanica TaxID=56036 RepID=A0AAD1YN44_9LAMI|nr:unnamed protein product [Fraxinus pennsylvanica]
MPSARVFGSKEEEEGAINVNTLDESKDIDSTKTNIEDGESQDSSAIVTGQPDLPELKQLKGIGDSHSGIPNTLLVNWTIVVDEWPNATKAITEVAKESVKTSSFEENEGLPPPPMDEGDFFAIPTSMELSQAFRI